MPVGPTTARRLSIGLGVGTVLLALWLWGRGDDEPTPTPTTSQAEPTGLADRPELDPPESTEPSPIDDCDALAERTLEDDHDAVLLAWLCPERPLDAIVARAALLAVRSPDEAAALSPRLHAHPELRGLARLVAQERMPAVAGPLPDPAHAVVSPIDDEVLARVQQAHGLVATPGLPLAERTRARAYLAKAYLQATQQLGVTVGRPPGPFGRLLSGRALHYGREFCSSYWRNRVAGLAPLFGELETRLLELTLALEGGPSEGDAARLAVELELTRGYLHGDGARARIERRLAEPGARPWAPRPLLPTSNAIQRLLAHGFVDLALAHALAEGRQPDGPGLAAVEQRMRDELARAEQGEYLRLLEHRFERTRALSSAPPEEGPGTLASAVEPGWPAAEQVAERAAMLIEDAPRHGLSRGHALGRALLLLRERPDALLPLLDRASDEAASSALRGALPWLLDELRARDDGRRAWQQRIVAAEARVPPGSDDEQEAARRRRFALRVREDDRLPRGPGLGRSVD
ncbi:MAG: hypothetical protein KC501_04560 [Myxococcales bacterium]|nr:hypothetical protein [Myxococcales bacterium]